MKEEKIHAAFSGDDGAGDPRDAAGCSDVHALSGAERDDLIARMIRQRVVLFVSEFVLQMSKRGSGFYFDDEIFKAIQNDVTNLVEDIFPEEGNDSFMAILMGCLKNKPGFME